MQEQNMGHICPIGRSGVKHVKYSECINAMSTTEISWQSLQRCYSVNT